MQNVPRPPEPEPDQTPMPQPEPPVTPPAVQPGPADPKIPTTM